MIERTTRLLLLAGVCLAFANGCGDSGTHVAATPTAVAAKPSPSPAASPRGAGDDAAFAASMLMTKDDFPRDYLEKKRVSDAATDAFGSCKSETEHAATGTASTDDWLFDGQSPAIIETVTVFGDASGASARIQAARALIDCAARAINNGDLNDTAIEISRPVSKELTLDIQGGESAAFELQASQTSRSQTTGGTVRYTVAFVSRGRVVAEILVRGSGAPFDAADLSDLARSALARIPQQQ